MSKADALTNATHGIAIAPNSNRDVTALANVLNTHHANATRTAIETLESMFQAGSVLEQIKGIQPHGKYEPFIEEHFQPH